MSITLIEVTEKLIKAGMSARGGWNKKQLAILDVTWPPKSGWKKAAIGQFISADDAAMFVSLKPAK